MFWSKPKIRKCKECDHFLTGGLDHQANWMQCRKDHRLMPKEKFTHDHTTPTGEKVKVDDYGWSEIGGSGEPMLDRTDCRDWKKKKFRLDLGDPGYN